MAKKYIDMTDAQKDEIRRLTQFANRRIKGAQKVYAKEGMDVLPRDVVGDYQIKEQWNTKSTPISRSVKFESKSAYRKQLQFLRTFEVTRPSIKEYTKVQQDKTIEAVETSLGVLPEGVGKKIKKMTAPQLSNFWNKFSDRAVKLGGKYSSNDAMEQTLTDVFPEDAEQIVEEVQRERLRISPVNYG